MVYRRKKDTCASAGDEEDITVASIERLFAILTHHLLACLPRLHYHYFVVAERLRWLRWAWLPVTDLSIATAVTKLLHDQY